MAIDSAQKPKALLVDDDKFLLGLYAKKFQEAGYEVDAIAESTAALKKIEDGARPDLCVFDVLMPGIDGLELVEKIREKNLLPQGVIVILSNNDKKEDIERAKKLHVNGYIVKATSIPSEVVGQVDEIFKGAQKK